MGVLYQTIFDQRMSEIGGPQVTWVPLANKFWPMNVYDRWVSFGDSLGSVGPQSPPTSWCGQFDNRVLDPKPQHLILLKNAQSTYSKTENGVLVETGTRLTDTFHSHHGLTPKVGELDAHVVTLSDRITRTYWSSRVVHSTLIDYRSLISYMRIDL